MNDQNGGTAECDSDEVPPVKAISVKIDESFFEAIRNQVVEQLPDLKDELSPMPIDVFIALPGNKVVEVSPDNERTFVPGPDDRFVPRSLIPVAFFVGVGSGVSGCSVNGRTKYRNYG